MPKDAAPQDSLPIFAWTRFALDVAQTAVNAGEVVTRRMTRLASGRMSAPDAAEMVFEKAVAFSAAQEGMATAVAAGAPPLAVMQAATAPYSEKTRSNLRALRR